MAEPVQHGHDAPEPGSRDTTSQHAPGALGAPGWDPAVARAVHTARVFGPAEAEGLPAAEVGLCGVPTARWELAVGAQGAARLLSALWVEATARGLPVPAEVAAAIRALSVWSKELI
ncbi:MAG TPA: hypothetical protein VG276_09195 [Actinomycetes bacterium]|jgi:hypothetical protein|nr:hypothetical protein [Actinomycetes bacterium]